MASVPGVFIVLEGADGSGKGTQFKLLTERLRATGYDVVVFDFPRYDQPSSHFVKKYLNGDYGPATAISPYAASLFFALDRFETAPHIRRALEEGKIVLANRYVGSNMAHQGSKFGRPAERRGFFMWADNLEYEVLGIPRPNLNLFLRVPAELAYQLISRKAKREYTKGSQRDQHEADINHLRESVATYDLLCQLFPKDFEAIDCTPGQQLLSVPEINDLIWQRLKPLLPPAKRRGRSTTIKLDEKLAPKSPENMTSTEQQSSSKLSGWAINSLLIANPELELSASSVGQSFYQPVGISKKANKILSEGLQHNLKLRNALEKQISKAAGKAKSRQQAAIGRALAAATSLGFLESVSFDKSLVSNWPPLGELQKLTKQKVMPSRADSGSGQYSSYDGQAVKLLHASYRNEFDALADADYQASGLSFAELAEDLAKADYQSKLRKLQTEFRQNPAFRERLNYHFELVCNSLTIRKLISSGLAISVLGQTPSPRLGYGIPALIDEYNLADSYSLIFDASLELFDQLQSAAPAIAPYAVLRGHRGRYQLEASAARLYTAKSQADKPLKRIITSLIDQLVETNPVTADLLQSAK